MKIMSRLFPVVALLGLAVLAADPDQVAVPVDRPGIGKPLALQKVESLDGPVEVNEGPLVIAMTSTTCPLSRKFAPVLGRLSARKRYPLRPFAMARRGKRTMPSGSIPWGRSRRTIRSPCTSPR